MKKVALLFLLMVMGLVFAISASAETYSGECGVDGENLTWSVDTTTSTLSIQGNGKMRDFESYGWNAPWSDYNDLITSVNIGDGVTYIGTYAFRVLEKVSKIVISKSVEHIGKACFGKSQKILVDKDNPYITMDEYGVIFSDDATVLVYASENLGENYYIPNGVVFVTDSAFADEIFYKDFALTTLYLPKSLIMLTRCAFGFNNYDCKVPYIYVDEYNMNYSSDEFGVLYDKDKTIVLMAPYVGDNEGLALKNYVLPETVKTISDYAFYGCDNSSNLYIGENVERIGKSAFVNTYNEVMTIYLPSTVKFIDEFFLGSDEWSYTIFYSGTREQWEKIENRSNYESNLTIYFEHRHNFIDVTLNCKKISKCNICGIVKNVDTNNHMTIWVSNNDSTCIKDGTKTLWCENCNTYFETITDVGTALDHMFTNGWTTILTPSCSDRGVQIRLCDYCNCIESKELSKINHIDANSDQKCDICFGDINVKQPTPDEPAPQEPEKELNFFQKIADWFKNLFSKLFGWLKF